jgi:hypothetical protein
MNQRPEINEEKSNDPVSLKTNNMPAKTEAKSLMQILKENLTSQVFAEILIIFDTPFKTVKAFLIFFTVAAFALASYTSITLILDYLNYGVTTLNRNIYENPAVFPKVTICNLNSMTTEYAYEFLKNFSTNKAVDIFDQDEMGKLDLQTQWFYFSSVINEGLEYLDKNSLSEQKKLLGHSWHDSLIDCQFDRASCSADDFSWEYDRFFGNCYSFNSGMNFSGNKQEFKKSILQSSSFGLQIELYVDYFEELSYLNSINGGKGAVIRIENTSFKIDFGEDGIQVASGASTNLVINREFKSSLPKPYSNCEDLSNGFSSNLYNLILNSKYDYSQQFCLMQCLQQLFLEKCNCILSIFGSVFKASGCVSFSDYECVTNDAYLDVYSRNDYVNQVCVPQCPLECNSTKYRISQTTYNLLGGFYVNKIKNNANLSADFVTRQVNASTAKDSFVRLKVFYDSLSYSVSEETAQWTIINLIATMGGNLGLFLGLGLLSFAEVFIALIEVFFSKLSIKKIGTF